MGERILIVEDEETLCKNVARFLGGRGHQAITAFCGNEAVTLMDREDFDIVITDLHLDDMNGLDLLAHIPEAAPMTAVLVITAYSSVESAVEAFRKGVHDYLVKPFALQDLDRKIENIAKCKAAVRRRMVLRRQIQGARSANIIGRSQILSDVMRVVEKVARTNSMALITGESGTGKELIAKAIHDRSARRDAIMVPFNVAAMPEGLVESYLFGHKQGSFTGATSERKGLFQICRGGTVFLDEIGDLPLQLQPKLLRALESKEILPVGADKPIRVDARVIAATNRDLDRMVHEGRFRQDLLQRLNTITIRVPSLRERREDIRPLVRHFLNKHKHEVGRLDVDIDRPALHCLQSYDWSKGNVRELSNTIERAVILCEGDTIRPQDLPSEIRGNHESNPTQLRDAVRRFEAMHVAQVLEQVDGNRQRAAELLGISPATLYRRLGNLSSTSTDVDP